MQVNIDTTPAASLALEVANQYGSITAYEIADDYAIGRAAETLREITTSLKLIDERRKELTRPLDAAKAEIMDIFRAPVAQLESAKTVIRAAITSYEQAAQKRRIEAQRAAEEKARAEEQARKLELAEAAEKDLAQGRTIAAMDKLNQAENVVIIPERVEAPIRPSNVSMVTRWKHEVIDQAQLPIEYMIPNEAMLAALAKSMKEKAKVPGVRFYAEQTAALRGAR